MLMIRLQRVGRRNHAEFRLVVTEKTRAAKSSNYIELLGNYNPHTNTFTCNKERSKHWMEVGAKASDTVHNLFVEKGIITGKKINVLPKKSPIQKVEVQKTAETATTEGSADSTDSPGSEEQAAAKKEAEEEVVSPEANDK